MHKGDVVSRGGSHGVPGGAPGRAAAPAPRAGPAPAAGAPAPPARPARLQRVERAALRLLPTGLAQDEALYTATVNVFLVINYQDNFEHYPLPL